VDAAGKDGLVLAAQIRVHAVALATAGSRDDEFDCEFVMFREGEKKDSLPFSACYNEMKFLRGGPGECAVSPNLPRTSGRDEAPASRFSGRRGGDVRTEVVDAADALDP
jgi:hypothetical protein